MAHRMFGWILLQLFKLLPNGFTVRHYWRKIGTVDEIFHNSPYLFKLAESDDEIRQSYQLLYNQYKNSNLSLESRQFIRVTKHHALPTSDILIAKKGDEVVATLTLIPDSTIGLPMDAGWNLHNIRNSHASIAEISALSIKEGFHKRSDALLFPMFAFLLKYCKKTLEVNALVISTPLIAKGYYQSLLGFKPLSDPKQHLPYSGETKAFGQYLSLTDDSLSSRIRQRPRLQGDKVGAIYQALLKCDDSYANILIPKTKEPHNKTMSLHLFDELFAEEHAKFFNLSPEDRKLLCALFAQKYSVQSPKKEACFAAAKNHQRFSVYIPARVYKNISSAHNSMIFQELQTSIYDVSKEGLSLCCPQSRWKTGDELKICLQHPLLKDIELGATIVWSDKDHLGLHIACPPNEWISWVSMCESKWRQQMLSAA